MIITLFSVIAIASYLLCLTMLSKGIMARLPVDKQRIAVIGLIGSGAHLLSALLLTFSNNMVDLSLSTSGSLIFALASATISISSLRKPVHALLIVIQPICLLLILLSIWIEPTKLVSVPKGMSMHILLSILAYGMITIAAASALVFSYSSYKLKHKKIGSSNTLMPPLETIDKLLFEIILVGQILLTASIASGFLFVENFFGQHLAHKTFFALISWFIFSILLAGHHFWGWRGARAMKLTIAGFIMLLLAYAGVKFVYEILQG